MRNKVISVLLASFTAGSACAQVANSPGSSTNAAPASSAAPQSAASTTNLTNAFQPAPTADEAVNEKGTFGVGPIFGEPLGVNAKVWLSDKFAVDGGLGWSFVDPDGAELYGDALFHKFDLLRKDKGDLPVYIGIGGRVKFTEHGDNLAGIRVPIGISYLMQNQRLEFYAEVAPILDVAPTTTLNWNGGVGIRYYFK